MNTTELKGDWEEQKGKLKQKFANGVVPLPDFWGGYRVKPRRFEFWQGGKDRLHDRFSYEKNTNGEWEILRLAP